MKIFLFVLFSIVLLCHYGEAHKVKGSIPTELKALSDGAKTVMGEFISVLTGDKEIEFFSSSQPEKTIAKRSQISQRQLNDAVNTACGDGRIAFSAISVDTCNAGVSCTATQAICSNTTIDVKSYSGAQLIAAECTITKMLCFFDALGGYVEVDFSAVYGASSCKIKKAKCGATIKTDVNSISNLDLFGCNPQLECVPNGVEFGYESWAFNCGSNNVITCPNGPSTDTFQLQISDLLAGNFTHVAELSNSCVTEKVGFCPLNPRTSPCTQYTLSDCDGGVDPNGCAIQKIDTTCSGSPNIVTSTLNDTVWSLKPALPGNCLLQNLICKSNGSSTFDTVVAASSLAASEVSNCIVSDVLCGASSISVGTVGSPECVSQGLTCSGVNADSCKVSGVICSQNAVCTNKQFVCQGAPKCSVAAVVSSCTDPAGCTKSIQMPSCNCPLDKTGASCSTPRVVTCSITLLSPEPKCTSNPSDPKDNLLVADAACLFFEPTDTASLRYRLNCGFSPAITIPANDGFTYYIKNDNIAISEVRNWTIRFKIFNFNTLLDVGATQWVDLDPDQMLGLKSIYFNVSLASIPDQYWAGNRIYFEASFSKNNATSSRGGAKGLQTSFLERRYLDSPNHKPPAGTGNQIDNALSAGAIAGIVVGSIAGVVLILIFIFRKRIRAFRDRWYERQS